MCAGADAFQAQDSRGLMQHIVRMHLGQQLSADAIAQLRHLGKAACRICGSIRASTNPQCSYCGCATATRPLQLGDTVPDRRRLPAGTVGQHTGERSEVAPEATSPAMEVDSDVEESQAAGR